MSNIEMSVSFPLDDDFFRRQCPLCKREFKYKATPEELSALVQASMHALLADSSERENAASEETQPAENWCPYCGQRSDSWWTEEQTAYINVHAQNVMAQLLNEHFIRPMKRQFGSSQGGMLSIKFSGREMEEQEPWISPEPNDMVVFPLPCCRRELKIEERWAGDVHCFFCGFPHSRSG